MQGTQICKDVSPQRLARQHFSSLIDLACNSLLVYLPCHSRISLTVSSIQLLSVYDTVSDVAEV